MPRFLNIPVDIGVNIDSPKLFAIGMLVLLLAASAQFFLNRSILKVRLFPVLFAAFCSVLLVSVSFSPDPVYSLIVYIGEFAMVYAFFYYGRLSEPVSGNRLFQILFIAVTTYSSLYVILEYIFAYNPIFALAYQSGEVALGYDVVYKHFGYVASGFWGISLETAQIQFACIVLGVWFYTRSGHAVYLFVVGITFVAFLLTQSRSASLLLLVFFGLMLNFRLSRVTTRNVGLRGIIMMYKYFVTAIFLFVLYYLLVDILKLDRILAGDSSVKYESLNMRMYAIGLGLSIISSNPLGAGYGVFTKRYLADISSAWQMVDENVDFSMILTYGMESGVVGMLLYLSIIMTGAVMSYRKYRKEKTAHSFVLFSFFLLYPMLNATSSLLFPMAIYFYLLGNFSKNPSSF